VGHLSISGSTFTNNTAAGIGGAIATDAHGTGTTISIQNSTFTGNTATNSFGGALDLDGTNLNTTPFSLTHLTITGNTAGQSGGGVFVGKSNVTLSKSLIVGNSAPTGSGMHKSVDAATATVTNNWWGCSTGPGAAPCDRATTAGGTLSFTPWYRDQLTATTSPIAVNQSTALTASFLTNSAGGAVPVADLAELIGRSVSWAATNGNLSGTQGTIQAAGTATGSFQATAAGTAVISAKVDHDNTSPVSANVLSLTINKANTTTTITSDTPDPTVTGQGYTVSYSVASSTGSTPTAPTGNVTVSDGTSTCTGTVAAGQCTLVSTTAGNKTLTATYAGDANFNASPASAGVAHIVNKADTTTAINADTPDPSLVSQAVTVQYSVSVNAPGGGTPTGNVTVSDGTQSCIGTVAAGSCAITFTTIGNRTLTAAYAGDSDFNGSTSASEPHTVTRTNQPPTANADAYTMLEDHALTVNAANGVLKNDTDPDAGETLTAVKVGDPSHGTLTLNSDGSFSYTPDPNFNGSDSFSYKARDSFGAESAVAVVTLGITPVNDAPTFTKGPNVRVRPDAGPYSAPWATAISAGAANESSQTLTFQVTGNTNPGLFSAGPSLDSNGSLSFTPVPNAEGSATITVVLKDNGGTVNGGVNTSAPQSFTITITSRWFVYLPIVMRSSGVSLAAIGRSTRSAPLAPTHAVSSRPAARAPSAPGSPM